MHKLDNFIVLIRSYLQGKETASERRDLYEMYDRIEESDTFDEKQRTEIAMNAKRRIFRTIIPRQNTSKILRIRWGSAAAAVLVLGSIAFYWLTPPNQRVASAEELANFEPGKEHAIILLPTGETVNLDSIPLAQSIQIGNTKITKSESGEISYEDILSEANPIYTLYTPRSATSKIVLSDGTKVLLNAESKLYYPAKFGEGDRIVKLEGEGYFQVTKTSSKSRFIVESKNQQTIVLGTKFNVKAYSDDQTTWTTLEEGSVRVSTEKNGQQDIVLSRGQQSVLRAGRLHRQTVDLESTLGWTKGIFYFDGTNTADVLKEIEDWYDIDITYKERKQHEEYSGKIPRNLPLDQLIDLLSYADFKIQPLISKENRVNLIVN